MLSFEQWTDHVEQVWKCTLEKSLGEEGVRAAVGTMKPMFAFAAGRAYDEYVAGWKRHRRKASRKAV